MTAHRRLRTAALTCALAGVPILGTSAAALAVDSGQVGVFPSWTVSGVTGAFTAAPAFPDAAGFPATSLTTTSTTLASPSGVTAFLGAGTAFGTEYGSTRAQPYLTIAPASAIRAGSRHRTDPLRPGRPRRKKAARRPRRGPTRRLASSRPSYFTRILTVAVRTPSPTFLRSMTR